MKTFLRGTLVCFLYLNSLDIQAQSHTLKRRAPKPVVPVIGNDVKYTAPIDRMGYIVAFDLSDKWLWSKKIYTVTFDPGLEADVQGVFIDSLYFKDDRLYIRNERQTTSVLDVKSGQVAGIHNFDASKWSDFLLWKASFIELPLPWKRTPFNS